MQRRTFGYFLAAVIAGVGAAPADATTILIDSFDSGHFEDGGSHSSTNENYIVGLAGDTFRNFFVFDLTGVLGPGESIQSATLRLEAPNNSYSSIDAAETFGIFEVTTPPAQLLISSLAGSTGQAIYADLGDGPSYGTRVLSEADENTIVQIALNGTAVSALNGATGLFALGGALATIQSSFPDSESAFGFTGNTSTRQLELVVIPEPQTAALLAAALVGLALSRHRRSGRHSFLRKCSRIRRRWSACSGSARRS